MKQSKIILVITLILLVLITSSCANRVEGVICFVLVEPYEPNSGAELLEELNSHLPFKVPPQNFRCEYFSDTNHFVGWIITKTIEQKDIVKQELKKSTTLKVLQVELLTPEEKALFKNEWKQSQTVGPPQK